MFLADKEIKKLNGVITPFDDNLLQSISYDLTTRSFHYVDNDGEHSEDYVELNPLDSVFVSSNEVIELPNNLAAIVVLRNRFIRLGLHLDAPVYLPGHKTRIFYRVTNVSQKKIALNIGNALASVMFQPISGTVEHPYSGAYSDEMNFKGLGVYRDAYKGMLKEADYKLQKINNTENAIYGNVMVMMTIFVALFSIINVNIGLAKPDTHGIAKLLVFNLSTIGSIAELIGFIQMVVAKKTNWILLAGGGVAILAAIALAVGSKCL